MNDLIISPFTNVGTFNFYVYKSCIDFGQINFDEQMFKILDYLNNKTYNYSGKVMSFDNVQRYNKYFFDKYVPLQDICCLPDECDVSFKTSPLNIPIRFKHKFYALGQVIPCRGDLSIYTKILLADNLKGNLVSIYAHELVHTQIEHNLYELCENYFDREFLSVFIELVSSYYCSPIYNRDAITKRLYLLKHNLKRVKDEAHIEASCYMISTLKAFHLYDLFINSDDYIKKEILNSIEDIFKQDSTINTLSDKYEINFENSKKLKYISK